jgi:hypothetical protein
MLWEEASEWSQSERSSQLVTSVALLLPLLDSEHLMPLVGVQSSGHTLGPVHAPLSKVAPRPSSLHYESGDSIAPLSKRSEHENGQGENGLIVRGGMNSASTTTTASAGVTASAAGVTVSAGGTVATSTTVTAGGGVATGKAVTGAAVGKAVGKALLVKALMCTVM